MDKKQAQAEILRDGDKVTIVMPYELARYARRAFKMLGLTLLGLPEFRESEAVAATSLLAAADMAQLEQGLAKVGVE